jgi:hypothetical protein
MRSKLQTNSWDLIDLKLIIIVEEKGGSYFFAKWKSVKAKDGMSLSLSLTHTHTLKTARMLTHAQINTQHHECHHTHTYI